MTPIKKNSLDAASVKAIKVQLNTVLNTRFDVSNGIFGNETEAAVKRFQKANRLLDDGVVGALTWERLFAPLCNDAIIKSEVLRIRAQQIMLTQLHVRELTGNNDGKEVEKYLKSVGLPKGYAWCVALPFWAFSEASRELQIENPMPKTAGVMDCLKRSKMHVLDISKEEPQIGDLGCMDFGKGKGHMYMITANRNNRIFTVEGNTSADPAYKALDREGNGVFERNRTIASTKAFIRYE